MKKILRLVTTSVLTLTLVACGEASSSVSTSGTQTSSSVSSPSTSAFANVTTITLTAASDTLTQVLGSLKRVTVSAALNANTNPALALEWFVDGVKSNQTGRIFEFTPTAVGNFVLQAKVGNVLSNTVTVAVGQGGLAVETAKFADADTIELKAPGGATVTVVGHEVADTSYYSLAKGTYVIDLKKAVAQGTTVTVNLAGSDGKSVVQQVTYDLREFKLDTLELDGVELTADSDGVYKIVRPFDAGVNFRKEYKLNFLEDNILSATPVQFRTLTTAPVGATVPADNATLVTALSSKSFFVDNTTVPGLYTHTVELGAKSVTVKVLVEAPKATVEMAKEFSFENAKLENEKFEFAYTVAGGNKNASTARVLPDAAGVYVITKPFTTSGSILSEFEFNFLAKNFVKPEFTSNQFNVTLKGPSSFSSDPNLLFQGINTLNTSSGNADFLTNNLSFKTFAGATGFGANTSSLGLVRQRIDSGTPVGDYTFTITAGSVGNQVAQDVVVRVVAPTPGITFAVSSYSSSLDRDTGNTGLGLETRNQIVTTLADGTLSIEKPFAENVTYTLGWLATLSNYQSALLGTADFAEVTADSLITNLDNRKLFNAATKIKDSSANLPGADLLVKPNATVAVTVKAMVKMDPGATDVYVSAATTQTGLVLTRHAANDATGELTKTAGEVFELTIGTYTTTADVAAGVTGEFTIIGATLVNGGGNKFVIKVSNYPDVVEIGTGLAASANNEYYRFSNVSLVATGPSRLIQDLVSTRAAILLGAEKSNLILFNQTGAAQTVSGTRDQGGNGDPDDIYTDAFGFNRQPLSITSTTVAGLYTLKFTVDNLVREVKIQINNSQPKVFVLSGSDLIDSNADADFTKNNAVTSLFPSKVLTTNVQGAVGSNAFNYRTSGAGFERLLIHDNDGLLPSDGSFKPDPADVFVGAVAGVYEVDVNVATRLYAQIAVADLAKGEYDYSIVKKYPDGRVEQYSDKVTVTSLDANQIATFDSLNTKFINNWIVNETTVAEGLYEFEFTVGGVTKKFSVNVEDKPLVSVDKVYLGGSALPLFNGSYSATLTQFTLLKKAVKFDFTKENITSTDYYKVTAAVLASGSTSGTQTVTSLTIADLPATYVLIDDSASIGLGTVADPTGGTDLAAGHFVRYTVEFFSKVTVSATNPDGYSSKGKVSFDILAATNPAKVGNYATISNDGGIVEGAEKGEVLTIKLFGDTFVASPTLDSTTVNISNIPAGIITGTTYTRLNDTTLLVTLGSNTTVNYDSTVATSTVTLADAIITRSIGATLVSPAVQLFKGTDERATTTTTSVEGEENDKVIVVSMVSPNTTVASMNAAARIALSTATIGTVVYQTDATAGFYRLTNLPFSVEANWVRVTNLAQLLSITGLPSGVTFDGVAITAANQITVTLKDNTNEDYDLDKRVQLNFTSLVRPAGAFSVPAILPHAATGENNTYVVTGTALVAGGVEGSENTKTIIITATGTPFANAQSSGLTATGLPAGVTATVSTTTSVITVTLSGNATEDYDVNKRVKLAFADNILDPVFHVIVILEPTVEIATASVIDTVTTATVHEDKVITIVLAADKYWNQSGITATSLSLALTGLTNVTLDARSSIVYIDSRTIQLVTGGTATGASAGTVLRGILTINADLIKNVSNNASQGANVVIPLIVKAA